MFHKEGKDSDGNAKSILVKIWDWILYPFEIIRMLTIPPCEKENFDNRLVILWPWFGIPTAIFLQTLSTDFWYSTTFKPIWVTFSFLWSVFSYANGA